MGQSLAYNLWRTLENSTPVKAAHEFAAQILLIEKDPTVSINHLLSIYDQIFIFNFLKTFKLKVNSKIDFKTLYLLNTQTCIVATNIC